MNANETLKKFHKLLVSMSRSAASEHVLLSAEDLEQEARIVVWKIASSDSFPEKDEEQTKLVRACVLNAFRNLVKHNREEAVVLSLDEDVGSENDDTFTRHDVLGVEPQQEDHLVMAEHRQIQAEVAKARMRSLEKEGRKYGKTSRIQEIVTLKAQGLSGSEIGEKLGITKQAVNKTLAKLRKNKAA